MAWDPPSGRQSLGLTVGGMMSFARIRTRIDGLCRDGPSGDV